MQKLTFIYRYTDYINIYIIDREVQLLIITMCSGSDDVLVRISNDGLDSGFVMRMRKIEI